MRREILNFLNTNCEPLQESDDGFRMVPIVRRFIELCRSFPKEEIPTETEWRELDEAFQEKRPEYRASVEEKLPYKRHYRMALLLFLGLRSKDIMFLLSINSMQQVSNLKCVIKKKLSR